MGEDEIERNRKMTEKAVENYYEKEIDKLNAKIKRLKAELEKAQAGSASAAEFLSSAFSFVSKILRGKDG
jgi:hypothetical protein